MKSNFYFTFILILLSCTSKNESVKTTLKKRIVGIQPYENISIAETKKIAQALDSFYGCKSIILPPIKHDKKSFISIKSPRYRADSIIRFQNRTIPSHVDYIVGVTNSDISTTKHDTKGNIEKPTWKYSDFGVMGLAYRPGNSAIISTFRLKHKNKKLAFTRFKKVTIHEFGHNLGLPHCPNKKCVMTAAAEKISTIDNENLALCKSCKNKIN